jgi:hypothetical protein
VQVFESKLNAKDQKGTIHMRLRMGKTMVSKALVGNPKKASILFAKVKRRTFRVSAVKLPTISMQAFADNFPASWESRGTKNRFIRIMVAVDSDHFRIPKDIIKQTIMEKT